MSKSFFSRWGNGVKVYASSPQGLLLSQLFFGFFVFVGLFVAGVQRFVKGDFWFGVVLVSFGFLQLIDFRLKFRAWVRLGRSQDLFKQFDKGGLL